MAEYKYEVRIGKDTYRTSTLKEARSVAGSKGKIYKLDKSDKAKAKTKAKRTPFTAYLEEYEYDDPFAGQYVSNPCYGLHFHKDDFDDVQELLHKKRNPKGVKWKKGTYKIHTRDGKKPVTGYISGNGKWGIGKYGSAGFVLTHIPSGIGASGGTENTLGDLKNLVELLGKEVYNAKTKAAVLKHTDEFMRLYRQPDLYKVSKSKFLPRTPRVSDLRDKWRNWLGSHLDSLGTYSGRSGKYYGKRGARKSPHTYAISLGNRDVSLQHRLVQPSYGKFEVRWVLEETQLISKVDEGTMRRWVELVRDSPTVAEVKAGQKKRNPRAFKKGDKVEVVGSPYKGSAGTVIRGEVYADPLFGQMAGPVILKLTKGKGWGKRGETAKLSPAYLKLVGKKRNPAWPAPKGSIKPIPAAFEKPPRGLDWSNKGGWRKSNPREPQNKWFTDPDEFGLRKGATLHKYIVGPDHSAVVWNRKDRTTHPWITIVSKPGRENDPDTDSYHRTLAAAKAQAVRQLKQKKNPSLSTKAKRIAMVKQLLKKLPTDISTKMYNVTVRRVGKEQFVISGQRLTMAQAANKLQSRVSK